MRLKKVLSFVPSHVTGEMTRAEFLLANHWPTFHLYFVQDRRSSKERQTDQTNEDVWHLLVHLDPLTLAVDLFMPMTCASLFSTRGPNLLSPVTRTCSSCCRAACQRLWMYIKPSMWFDHIVIPGHSRALKVEQGNGLGREQMPHHLKYFYDLHFTR